MNKNFSCRAQLAVDRSAIRANVRALQGMSCQCDVLGVVKANAYGHGFANVIPHIDPFVDYYAVNNIIEARTLLKFTSQNILILQDTRHYPSISPQIHYTLSHTDIQPKYYSTPTNFHIALNTGMNRLGIPPQSFHPLISRLSTCTNIHITGVYSHISDSSNTIRTNQQIQIFNQHTSGFHNLRHIASSSSFSIYPNSQFNMVRVGIGLYGYLDQNTLPVMSVYSQIIHIHDVPANSYIGYGSDYLTTQPTKIAILDIGYADGLPRSLSNAGFVLIHNTPCQILGNICMNMTLVDISHTNAKIGDLATILSTNLPASTLANLAHTIPYQILTNFTTLPTHSTAIFTQEFHRCI